MQKKSSKTTSSNKTLRQNLSQVSSSSHKTSGNPNKRESKTKIHRSFRLTSRRDYARSLDMPGYIGFTKEVFSTLWQSRKLFGGLTVFYALAVIVVGGVLSQENYIEIQNIVTGASEDASSVGRGLATVGDAGVVLLSSLGGSGNLSEVQQVYLVFALLLVWLTTVWLLREIRAGRYPKLRDGLYNAGSPILSTIIILVVLLMQLLPLAITAIIYAALVSAGLASEGLGAMIAVLGLVLVAALTLYWLTSTFIALVIVTLPGMYPVRALRAAGDLVVSRRLRVLYRLLWMMGLAGLVWAVVMIPTILIESWVRANNDWLSGLPTVPLLITVLSALTTLWATAYVYLLYRKLVDDGSTPG